MRPQYPAGCPNAASRATGVRAPDTKVGVVTMDAWDEGELPRLTRDLDQAKADLDRFGYCLLANALDDERLAAVRARLYDQALAEKQAGVAYFDGAPHQNWGSFRDQGGQLRTDVFSEAAGGINQRLWLLVNKGQAFIDLLSHGEARELIGHVLGEAYLLSGFDANIANPGGVSMKLHTDQWWMPAPMHRHRHRRVGSITRDNFDDDAPETAPMIAPTASCNIMWMLDDFTQENGATRIVPGSHMSGRRPDPEKDKDVPTVAAVGPAGAAMVFEGRLWHGTGANLSNTSRAGLLTAFCGPQFRPQENFAVGTRPEVLETASPDLLALLGFRVWLGQGRIDSPVAEFVDPEQPMIGEMQPDPAAR